jgi:hypothetical protein
VLVRRAKTDPQGRGATIAVCANPADPAFCPAAALEAWLRHRRAARDPGVFVSDAERPPFCAVGKSGRVSGARLSDKAVVRLVKQAAGAAGLDSQIFAWHSLRAGFADLLDGWNVVREWGRIGRAGRVKVELPGELTPAQLAAARLAKRKRGRGYR